MKLVIFDCDGTLVDSQHLIVSAMVTAFEREGLSPPPRETILSIVGLSLPYAVAMLVPDLEQARVHAISEGYKRAFGELRLVPGSDEPLYDGMRDILDDISAGDKTLMAIATGKSRRGVDRVLQHQRLEGRFVSIHTADNHPSKPHPEMIEAAMAASGVSAADTVMVGDTTFDIEMARAAGVRAIGVTWGYHPVDHLIRAGAHQICETRPDLRQALREFFSSELDPA